jgi:hypothetical protein
LPSRKNIALQREHNISASFFALFDAVFHFILAGNFDRNLIDRTGLARRLRL